VTAVRERTTVAARPTRRSAPQRGRAWLRSWLARPLTSFHLVLGVFVLLTGMGLVMVLSASSANAAAVPGGSAFSLFQRQLVFVVIGSVLFYIALRTPVRVVRALAVAAMIVSVVLLLAVLVPGIGTTVNGTRGWFRFGTLSFQPTEAAKIAIAVWGAHVLAVARPHLTPLRQLLAPLLPVSAVAALLMLLQPDLGGTVTLAIVVLALLWFGGMSMKVFLGLSVVVVAGAVAFGLTVGPRSARITSWLNPNANLDGSGYQALQARYSLADGGWWGLGLGQSRAKWNYLPNAHNDFIFAIIGEELGFIGCVAVLALFATLACVGLRIALRSVDPFLALLTATITVSLVSQAFLNIGYVTALLPVTGLQLPLISSGGTSTAITMFVFGLLANAARHEPQAIAALRTGEQGRLARMLRLPAPQPYSERRAQLARRAETPRQPARQAPRQAPRQAQRQAPRQAPRQVSAPARAPRARRAGPSGRPEQGGSRERGGRR